MDLTTQTPAEIDTALLAASNKRAEAMNVQERALQVIYRIENAEDYAKTLPWNSPDHLQVARAEVESTYETILSANAEIRVGDAKFDRRGGWTRYYLVLNSNGHVHSSTHCPSCFPTTQYAWLVEQSGMTPEALVELAGESACTDCFPWAPVNTLRRHSVLEAPERRAARLVREAEKAAREQTKIAKALTTDGSPFVVEISRGVWKANGQPRVDRESFKTEAAASQWVVGAIADNKMYDFSIDEKQAAIGTIVAAMADKHEVSVEEIMVEIDRKVAAKIKRDSRGY
jgi:hypothetical protein